MSIIPEKKILSGILLVKGLDVFQFIWLTVAGYEELPTILVILTPKSTTIHPAIASIHTTSIT